MEVEEIKRMIDRYKSEGNLITSRPEWMPFDAYKVIRKMQNKLVTKHIKR
jgi:hypothetical protein